MELEFYKYSGAGNDFIAINNMDGRIPEAGRRERVADWCRRGMSVGADGVLLIEPPAGDGFDFRMRYYNADGSEGETCGNGSRCIARFAMQQGIARSETRFETMAGPYEAVAVENEIRVSMTDAFGIREGIKIMDDVFEGEVHFLNTGVPHVVVFVDDVDGVDVFNVGRHLRRHAEFQPAGANVNFVRVRDPRNIEVRTYERGVENETLACGTGSIAAAIIAVRNGLAEAPVRVKTASGEILTIGFEPTAGGAKNVTLQGSARLVFRGYMCL
ncbi:MAG: diaminopimelate epimerase [Candidatus Sumerlaeaceae bacterium]|nr:diaminopimelate epimerase [Candidatus Sumerlaeaceae bacterium]